MQHYLTLYDIDVILKDLGSFFWSLWCLHSPCWKYFWCFPVIQTKVLVASLMIFTVLGCLMIFFFKLPFLELGNHIKISALCGGLVYAVSLRQFVALVFSSKTSKCELRFLKNQKAKQTNSVFINLKNPKSNFLRKSSVIRALTHYLGWAILQYLVLWCLLWKGLFSRPKQFLILYSLLYYEFTELIY